VWNAAIDGGRRLTFHLSGINNQNFIMRDEQTGSWWQQADGKAFLGPLRGTRLQPVFADEVSFATWRSEHPGGRVLRPAASAEWRAFSANWEATTDRLPVVSAAAGPLPPRALVVGLTLGGADRAYPVDILRRQGPVMDDLGGVPLAILTGDEGRSVRVFAGAVDGRRLSLFAGPAGAAAAPWVDGATGSAWSFAGVALSGPLAGRRLQPIPAFKDYWFDWRTYHPRTTVYTGGRASG
jgi:Protein of unknown function (DUF3179)